MIYHTVPSMALAEVCLYLGIGIASTIVEKRRENGKRPWRSFHSLDTTYKPKEYERPFIMISGSNGEIYRARRQCGIYFIIHEDGFEFYSFTNNYTPKDGADIMLRDPDMQHKLVQHFRSIFQMGELVGYA